MARLLLTETSDEDELPSFRKHFSRSALQPVSQNGKLGTTDVSLESDPPRDYQRVAIGSNGDDTIKRHRKLQVRPFSASPGTSRSQRALNVVHAHSLLLPLSTPLREGLDACDKQWSSARCVEAEADLCPARGHSGVRSRATRTLLSERCKPHEKPRPNTSIKKSLRLTPNDFESASEYSDSKENSSPNVSLPCSTNTSSFEDEDAVIHFSPPRNHRRLQSSALVLPSTPTKASPPKKKLASPKKRPPCVPFHTELQSSINSEFWNAGVIDGSTDSHLPAAMISPSKRGGTFDFLVEDDSCVQNEIIASLPQPKSVALSREEKQKRKSFDAKKENVAIMFLRELDEKITRCQLSLMTAETGGMKIIWSKKLNSTAGRANWRREAVTKRSFEHDENDCAKSEPDPRNYRHIASIELATKVITTTEQLYNAVAHEYCHLCNFMISNEQKAPHGRSFKAWASLVTNAFKDKGVKVTTRHSFEISYKYKWACAGQISSEATGFESSEPDRGCGAEYARHSRSIYPRKHLCGSCKGRLVQVQPLPRKEPSKKHSPEIGESMAVSYQEFVRQEFAKAKAQLDGVRSPSKDIMKEIAAKYRARKAEFHPASKDVPHDSDKSEIPNEKQRDNKGTETLEDITRQLEVLKVSVNN